MIEELNRVDNIGRYYFLGTSLFALLVASSCLAADITGISIVFFAVSGIHFIAGVGLLQRKKWGLSIARCLLGIDVFNRNPISEWLANLKDHQLDQFFK